MPSALRLTVNQALQLLSAWLSMAQCRSILPSMHIESDDYSQRSVK